MSFKPEVSTDGGRTFHQNALAFATREEAETSGDPTKTLVVPLVARSEP